MEITPEWNRPGFSTPLLPWGPTGALAQAPSWCLVPVTQWAPGSQRSLNPLFAARMTPRPRFHKFHLFESQNCFSFSCFPPVISWGIWGWVGMGHMESPMSLCREMAPRGCRPTVLRN